VANTYSQIYLHVVFAVSGRACVIQPNRKEELQKYMTGIITRRKQKLIAINCMPDHTHMLIGLKPDEAVSELIGRIKTGSSNHINEQQWDSMPFFMAGRIWRVFRFTFTFRSGYQLHSGPGEPPSPQAISPRVCGISATAWHSLR
jgi:REP element-mobilizing transposase RayT